MPIFSAIINAIQELLDVDTLHDRMRVHTFCSSDLVHGSPNGSLQLLKPNISYPSCRLPLQRTSCSSAASCSIVIWGGGVWSETEQGENENEHVPPQPSPPPRIMRDPIIPYYTFKNPYCFYQLNATSRDTNKINKRIHCYTILVVNDEIRISNPSCIIDNTVSVDLIRSAG